MKCSASSLFFLLLLLGLFPFMPAAQQFSKVLEGDIVNSPSDSRSVNIIDVNGDGLEDVFISNGLSTGQNNYLYLNQGNATFALLSDDPIVAAQKCLQFTGTKVTYQHKPT